MKTLTITLPLPPKELSPNARVHRMAKARKTKQYRETAYIAALVQLLGKNSPKHKRATVLIQWFHPTARFPDPTNLIGWMKSAYDGIEDSGFIENDRGLSPLPPEIAKDARNPRVVLTVTATEEQP